MQISKFHHDKKLAKTHVLKFYPDSTLLEIPNAAQRCAIWQTSYRTWKCYIFLGWVPPSWVPCSSQSPHNLVAGSEPDPRWNGVSSPAMVIACSRCWRGPEIKSSLEFFGLYKQMSGFESAGCLVSVTSPPCLFLAIFTAPKSHDLHSGIKCFFLTDVCNKWLLALGTSTNSTTSSAKSLKLSCKDSFHAELLSLANFRLWFWVHVWLTVWLLRFDCTTAPVSALSLNTCDTRA